MYVYHCMFLGVCMWTIWYTAVKIISNRTNPTNISSTINATREVRRSVNPKKTLQYSRYRKCVPPSSLSHLKSTENRLQIVCERCRVAWLIGWIALTPKSSAFEHLKVYSVNMGTGRRKGIEDWKPVTNTIALYLCQQYGRAVLFASSSFEIVVLNQNI